MHVYIYRSTAAGYGEEVALYDEAKLKAVDNMTKKFFDTHADIDG